MKVADMIVRCRKQEREWHKLNDHEDGACKNPVPKGSKLLVNGVQIGVVE